MSQGLQVDAHYTWSRTRDMATHSNGGGQTMDNYDIWRDYGPANWDVPHRFVASYIYDVPFLKDSSQRVPEVRRGRLAGVGRDDDPERLAGQRHDQRRPGEHRHHRPAAAGSRRRGARAQLPAELGGATDVARRQLINCYDASAFALPAQFTFGNAPRNVLRGPKFSSTDLSLMKNVPSAATARFQVRVEIFNVFNQVNYGNPNASFGAANFGSITSAGSMRQFQLGGKLLF